MKNKTQIEIIKNPDEALRLLDIKEKDHQETIRILETNHKIKLESEKERYATLKEEKRLLDLEVKQLKVDLQRLRYKLGSVT